MRKLLILAVMLFGAVSAFADPVNFAFLGYSGGQWQNGYPYFVSEGIPGTTLAVMCDDYAHGGAPGETWLANITNLGTGDLSLTRFNQLQDALTLYREAGWILLETVFTPHTQWMDMNSAAWYIFDNQAPLDSGAQGWLDAAQQEAQRGFPGVNFNLVQIITPVDQYDQDPESMQEFLHLTGSDGTSGGGAPAPEPGTLMLLGTGAVMVLRRKLLN